MMDNLTFFSVDQHLEQLLGRRYREPAYSWSISVVYCVILVTGLTGNICTLWVIAKLKKMHTATNCMPPEFYLIWVQYPWPFGSAYCVFKSFISELTSYASVLTILLFTIERWLAICYPMKSQLIAGVSRSVKILVAVWVSSLFCAAPYARLTRAFYAVQYPAQCSANRTWTLASAGNGSDWQAPCAHYGAQGGAGPIAESLTCSIPLEYAQLGNVLLQCSTGVFFIAPMIVITVLYVRIAVALSGTGSIFARNADADTIANGNGPGARRRTCRASVHKDCAGGSTGTGHTRRAALRILIAVVIVFFCSYAPYHLQRVISVHHEAIPSAIHILDYLYQFSAVFYYVSSAVNPILYNVASKRFRHAFVQVLCQCGRRRHSVKFSASSQSTVLRRQASNSERRRTCTVRMAHDATCRPTQSTQSPTQTTQTQAQAQTQTNCSSATNCCATTSESETCLTKTPPSHDGFACHNDNFCYHSQANVNNERNRQRSPPKGLEELEKLLNSQVTFV